MNQRGEGDKRSMRMVGKISKKACNERVWGAGIRKADREGVRGCEGKIEGGREGI